MIDEVKTLIAIILMGIGITLPMALVDGEWKIWAKVYGAIILAVVLIAVSLWLMGVR